MRSSLTLDNEVDNNDKSENDDFERTC